MTKPAARAAKRPPTRTPLAMAPPVVLVVAVARAPLPDCEEREEVPVAACLLDVVGPT